MKDTILIKKTGKGFKMTRTLSEDLSASDINERIKKLEIDVEAYTDARDNLINNKEEILKKNAEKIDNDAKAYDNAIKNLQGNIQALKDAVTLGQGKASSTIKGDSLQGAVE